MTTYGQIIHHLKRDKALSHYEVQAEVVER